MTAMELSDMSFWFALGLDRARCTASLRPRNGAGCWPELADVSHGLDAHRMEGPGPRPEWVRRLNAQADMAEGQVDECEKDIKEYLDEMRSDMNEAKGKDWNL